MGLALHTGSLCFSWVIKSATVQPGWTMGTNYHQN